VQGRTTRISKGWTAVLAVVAVLVLAVALEAPVDFVRDRLTGSDEVRPVAILEEGSTTDTVPSRTWTLDVAPGQTLIVNARAVELVRQDEGSRIDNTNPDRILLAAEGGHPYTVTLEDGRWVIVAEADARQEFCNQQASQDHDFGVQYKPSSWPSDVC